jgi:hypothetical protein
MKVRRELGVEADEQDVLAAIGQATGVLEASIVLPEPAHP